MNPSLLQIESHNISQNHVPKNMGEVQKRLSPRQRLPKGYLLAGLKGAGSWHVGVECCVGAVFVVCAESVSKNHSTGAVP